MFGWFWRLLYESTAREFPSAYGLAESVERLRAATKRSVFSALAETAAVGKVSENVVRLQRVIPMAGNSFKPFFLGHFESRGETAVLIGNFTLLPAVKVFMSVWFALCVLAAAGALVSGLEAHGSSSKLFLFQPFLMIGAGIALVAAGKWFARNDSAWLSSVIAAALSALPEGAPLAEETGAAADTVPMPLKVAAVFLAASGALAVLAGVAGIHSRPSWVPGGVGAASAQWGKWNFVYAILIIALSFGVWSRRPWAWRCGFPLLVLSVCWPLLVMSAPPGAGLPAGMQIVFAILSCVVVGFWGRWWYAQRKHFLWS